MNKETDTGVVVERHRGGMNIQMRVFVERVKENYLRGRCSGMRRVRVRYRSRDKMDRFAGEGYQ